MTSEVPKVNKTSRYSVKETATLLGVSTRTILRHTELNYLRPGIRECNGRKFYLGSEILRYWGAEYGR